MGGKRRSGPPVPGARPSAMAPLGLLLLAVAGTLFLGGPAWDSWQAGRTWVRGTGEVVETQAVVSRYSRSHPAMLFVRYRLAAGGAEARGSEPVDCGASRETCEEFAAREYPPGKAVEVWYDPDDPGKSALSVGPPTLAWLVGALVLLGLFAAVRMVAGGLARRSRGAARAAVFLDPLLAGGAGAVVAAALANGFLPEAAPWAVLACLVAGLLWGALRLVRVM